MMTAVFWGLISSNPGKVRLNPGKGYHGTVIGKGRQVAKTETEKLNLEEMTCRKAVKHAARIIYNVHDDAKDKEFELELSWVCDESKGFHQTATLTEDMDDD
ncbi:hypothetical protein EDD21DRAFT_415579 [Dissophora ornata]|nr:hypothetical protein EDD21DRAFT_415579 [Dissophora ornata]